MKQTVISSLAPLLNLKGVIYRENAKYSEKSNVSTFLHTFMQRTHLLSSQISKL